MPIRVAYLYITSKFQDVEKIVFVNNKKKSRKQEKNNTSTS